MLLREKTSSTNHSPDFQLAILTVKQCIETETEDTNGKVHGLLELFKLTEEEVSQWDIDVPTITIGGGRKRRRFPNELQEAFVRLQQEIDPSIERGARTALRNLFDLSPGQIAKWAKNIKEEKAIPEPTPTPAPVAAEEPAQEQSTAERAQELITELSALIQEMNEGNQNTSTPVPVIPETQPQNEMHTIDVSGAMTEDEEIANWIDIGNSLETIAAIADKIENARLRDAIRAFYHLARLKIPEEYIERNDADRTPTEEEIEDLYDSAEGLQAILQIMNAHPLFDDLGTIIYEAAEEERAKILLVEPEEIPVEAQEEEETPTEDAPEVTTQEVVTKEQPATSTIEIRPVKKPRPRYAPTFEEEEALSPEEKDRREKIMDIFVHDGVAKTEFTKVIDEMVQKFKPTLWRIIGPYERRLSKEQNTELTQFGLESLRKLMENRIPNAHPLTHTVEYLNNHLHGIIKGRADSLLAEKNGKSTRDNKKTVRNTNDTIDGDPHQQKKVKMILEKFFKRSFMSYEDAIEEASFRCMNFVRSRTSMLCSRPGDPIQVTEQELVEAGQEILRNALIAFPGEDERLKDYLNRVLDENMEEYVHMLREQRAQ